ncbi:helix-turn-helix transcriptional regulator [Streptacidiphilus sp. P02-A3a]|uniref:helix-turn-helix transcriptional regulator n=1 Tax=Streptacidiphilus sp. P02-A3a TaxID=2704468 RepID=UPI0015F90EAA|nr:helix-turn-helix transcriptional regulator [Streptacidiphilus sp. P02-A3a]QMU68167.1 helix-turn-helix domain-containing protein [Streptacidiphilus sp. P02-A3a]
MSVTDLPPTVPVTEALPGRSAAAPRRTELAAFLRTRRARVTPEDVGMAPGLRRRTPGLRREEVAQLAGVGVTWYTWLEQGRPINASEQVLGAIARTLRLDGAEQAHLYQLAGLRAVATPPPDSCPIAPEVQLILNALNPYPAALSNHRFDILRWNSAYEALFPGATLSKHGRRNSLWCSATVPECCNAFVNRAEELPRMVALLRSGYGRHVGEPYWEDFIRDLREASPDFARLWEQRDVAAHSTLLKVFRHAAVGEVRMAMTNLSAMGMPEARLVVYTPKDEESRQRMDWLLAHPGLPAVTHTH